MVLGPDEIRRYARHIVLKGVGGAGQQKLKAASVLIVGAGGLGSPAIAYLAAAGVGRITVIDDDRVALANLQRQVIHRTEDKGAAKAQSAKRFAEALNPEVMIEPIERRLTAENARALIAGHDLVLDGSDTFDTRLAVSDACFLEATPLVTGAIALYDGTLTTILAHRLGKGGEPLPTFRCLYPERPDPGSLPVCEDVGVLGPVAGVIGSLMAMEAIKLISGFGEPLVGRLLIYDGQDCRFSEMRYPWRAGNPLTGAARSPAGR
ncbi:MAG: HesA/MoeB/ThiF family protein [Cucumibacter sp.]